MVYLYNKATPFYKTKINQILEITPGDTKNINKKITL